ncbi:universal stress protein [Arsenicibacter rosenii]|uniref:UspA domain-containing protein n=1 Tax=Arsenicibacter rosenii TaxID=1750698 RepID=A0A1S2VCB0_9BACT|nr:universal stress protein [Arsenicibacter rosenii]OIN56354.1 hypothetical protein BLX24_25335 [Arsenicibacter rosenii]
MKRILLASDFSDASEHAFRYALNILGYVPCDCTLLHAFPIQLETAHTPFYEADIVQQRSLEMLSTLGRQLKAERNYRWHRFAPQTYPGNSLSAIQHASGQEKYDWIIVGASGRGLNPWLGSTSSNLLREARTNLMVVPATAIIRPLQHIVIATDYESITSPDVFEPIRLLAANNQAHLTLLCVLKPGEKVAPPSPEAQFRLRAFFGEVSLVTEFVENESAAEGIETFLNDNPTADLLVTVPRHRSWADAILGRSVTRQIVHHITIPLIALYDPTLTATETRQQAVEVA